MLSENTPLWHYLSKGQRSLIQEGFYLLEDAKTHTPIHPITDYSYIVFPVAKAFEGFLKQVFLDLEFIKKWQYESDHFRIGKALSPYLRKRLGDNSVYTKLESHFGNAELAELLWQHWKKGRNLVFHYFPHNLQAVTLEQAEILLNDLVAVMEKTVQACGLAT